MNSILLLGAPGSGKGSVASVLAPKLSIPHISTGDIFRYAVKNKTKLGREIEKIMKEGNLVSDELTIELVKERFLKDDVKKGYILDGFPRTLKQAEAFDKILVDLEYSLERVVLLDVADDVILKRITGRRVCSSCGKIYHIENMPPKKDSICDVCSGKVIIRKDDTIEVVKDRLEVYHRETEPLVKYYEKQRKLEKLDAGQSIEKLVLGILS